MRFFTTMLIGSVVLATAACGVTHRGGSAPTKTAVSGRVVLSPATPVCVTGKPCSKPLVGFTIVFSRDGKSVAQTTTGPGGRFSVNLAPGRYAVDPARGRGRLGPNRIAVPPAAQATVNFAYDTGIR